AHPLLHRRLEPEVLGEADGLERDETLALDLPEHLRVSRMVQVPGEARYRGGDPCARRRPLSVTLRQRRILEPLELLVVEVVAPVGREGVGLEENDGGIDVDELEARRQQ